MEQTIPVESNHMTFIELLDKHSAIIGIIIGLVGVIIGALISPLVSNRIEFTKRKRAIKYEIIGSIYIFYNLLKIQNYGHNNHVFDSKHILLLSRENDKQELILLVQHSINKTEDAIRENTYKLNEVEAKLTSLVVELGDYYGDKWYKTVEPIVTKAIKKSNYIHQNVDYDFSSINSLAALESIRRDYLLTVLNKGYGYQDECDLLVNDLNKILA